MPFPAYNAQPQGQPMMRPMAQPMMRPVYAPPPASIPRVSSAAEVDSFVLDGPGAEAIFLHDREDIFFYRSNDNLGRSLPTRAFRFEPLPEQGAASAVAYATQEEVAALRAEIFELKGVLNNGKQPRKAKSDTEE